MVKSDIREVLDRAADGQSETLLVFEEAGVGKTALVQHAVAGAMPSTLLLSGACLPLQSISVTLLPLRAASRAADSRLQRPWPLEAIDKTPALLDAWLQEVAGSAPVVLLIDDLHWADRSTLDVLMYLAAGPSDRRFALLGTVRSESLPDGHRFHRWLADTLSRPARDITSLVAVAGHPVRPELLQDVAADLTLTEVESALQEAEESRILTLVDSGRYWFQHPLQAQILEE